MKVERMIYSKKKKHFTLIDPANGMISKEKIKFLKRFGTDAIIIGGSTDIKKKQLDKTILLIKKHSNLPTILFPGGINGLSSHADALFFMSLLNSSDPYWITGIQAQGASIVKKLGIKTIPMAYIIVEPGMKAGEVGKAIPIKRDNASLAAAYALAAQHMGFRLVYLEAGAGADKPVPTEMIHAVKENISIPLIAGGGIRTPGQAKAVARAGADIIVTGTISEENFFALKEIIAAVKG